MEPSIYRLVGTGCDRPLRQGEILSTVIRPQVLDQTIGTPSTQYIEEALPLAIVLSQDCDLEQDHHVRFPSTQANSDKLLPGILLAEVTTAEEIFTSIASSNRKNWQRLNIEKNKNERFHFLQAVPPACDWNYEGLPELTIDFKRYFTLAPADLYRRIELGQTQRRTVLISPYLEHLSLRFAAYLCRVGLPTDHISL